MNRMPADPAGEPVLSCGTQSQRYRPVGKGCRLRLLKPLGFYSNVKDIDDGFAPGKQQLDFQIKPESRSLGLRSKEVARQVRHAYYGAEALRQQRGRNEVKGHGEAAQERTNFRV